MLRFWLSIGLGAIVVGAGLAGLDDLGTREEVTGMYDLIRVTGIVVVLTLLLAVLVSPAQAGETAPVSTAGEEQPAEVGGLVCLALVGGTAILAGGVLMEKLRSML